MNNKFERPLFIIGAQRSGTTILSLMLSRHSKVFLTVNGKILYYLIHWIYYDKSSYRQNHIRLDEIVYSLKRRPILGIEDNILSSMLDILSNEFSISDFYDKAPKEIITYIWETTYKSVCNDAIIVGDKYNEYLLQLETLKQIYPFARYIFIYRNGKDAAESMVRQFNGRAYVPRNYEEAFTKWAQWNSCWLDIRDSILSANKLEICYEDFVSNPVQTFIDIGQFLDIDISRNMKQDILKTIHQTAVGSGEKIDIDYDVVKKGVPEYLNVLHALGYK